MHRAISGDLQNEEEMERAMEEAGEEAIYQVQNNVGNDTVHSYSHSAAPLLWPPLFVLLIKKSLVDGDFFFGFSSIRNLSEKQSDDINISLNLPLRCCILFHY